MCSPHTIDLYDFGISDDGTFFYVMELPDGFDIEIFVQRFGPVRPARAVHILCQVCDSLAEAHEGGLIHRDIKPANVYICRYGREVDFIKVLDFGLVKPRLDRKEDDAGLTGEHIAGGTPAYMAPEQVLGDRPVDARTDLYAVGCLGYWLLTGQSVFEGETAMKIMMDHVRTDPVPPSERSELKIPRALDEALLACLEKDPEGRPRDADTLAATLRACGVEAPWTPEKAREWWDVHLPRSARRVQL
jgi:serine/threonine-protein kinase